MNKEDFISVFETTLFCTNLDIIGLSLVDDSHVLITFNVRDDANLNQLLVLANMESYNAILIEQGKSQSERLVLLRNLAIKQMDTLASINLSAVTALPGGDM